MKKRLTFNANITGELVMPAHATVLIPDFQGDIVTKRISGRGYTGGHNTASRLGWDTSYPDVPEGAVAYWDDTEEGRFTGYDPAIMVVLPFHSEEVAIKFSADLKAHSGWYSRPDHLEEFAERLEACIANGVQFTRKQMQGLRAAKFSIIGLNSQAAIAAWQRALTLAAH